MTESERLPEAMTCRECGYCVGGLPFGRCPECGAEVGARQVELHELISRKVLEWPQVRQMRLRLYLVVLPLYALGVGFLSRNWITGVMALVAMLVLVVSSWCAGWALSRLAPRTERTALYWLWVSCLPILHGPWLVLPIFLGVACVAAFVDDVFALDASLYALTIPGSLFIWGVGCFGCLAHWSRQWASGLGETQLRFSGWCGLSIIVLMFGTIGVSALLGLIGCLVIAGEVGMFFLPRSAWRVL